MTVRICHVTSAHMSNDIRILEKECVSLAKKEENDVYLVARGESYIYKNVNVVGIGELPSGRIARILHGSKKIYKRAFELDADIYHLHDPELLPYAKKFAKHGKKVIFDSHELYYNQILEKHYIPKTLRKFVASIYRSIENKACKYLSAAIFPCEIDGGHPFGSRVEKVEFINNYPIMNEVISDDVNILEPIVCCVGSLTRERGVSQLVEACNIAGVKLILGGEITPDDFKNEITKCSAFKNVDYRGVCSRKEVDEIYKSASIGVSNILHVGQYPKAMNLPTKVYEYMMYGLPFIISDTAYNKTIEEMYGVGITVAPENSNEIAQAISYLLENPEVYRRMSEKGKELVKNEFNWAIEEEKLYKLYASVFIV